MLLYKLGWHGLNIDCDQDKIELFRRLRPRDISVCAAIANSNKKMTLLRYPMSATNRLSNTYADADEQLSLCGEIPINSLPIKTKSLETVLSENNFENDTIDYLNIDVEGMELEVLEGIDFNKYMPALISVEIMDFKNRQLIIQFLGKQGYILSSIVRHNYFFAK
jgi:FkbM family methyltransferase